MARSEGKCERRLAEKSRFVQAFPKRSRRFFAGEELSGVRRGGGGAAVHHQQVWSLPPKHPAAGFRNVGYLPSGYLPSGSCPDSRVGQPATGADARHILPAAPAGELHGRAMIMLACLSFALRACRHALGRPNLRTCLCFRESLEPHACCFPSQPCRCWQEPAAAIRAKAGAAAESSGSDSLEWLEAQGASQLRGKVVLDIGSRCVAMDQVVVVVVGYREPCS